MITPQVRGKLSVGGLVNDNNGITAGAGKTRQKRLLLLVSGSPHRCRETYQYKFLALSLRDHPRCGENAAA